MLLGTGIGYGWSVSLPNAVLFDFSGTLFLTEDARSAVVAALGEQFAFFAPALQRWSAINGSDTPAELPRQLAEVWAQRDLSADAHRAAYSGLAMHAGLRPEQAARLYRRGVDPAAWRPFPDTTEVLEQLRARGIPVAVVSNIGWDPRPVLRAHGLEQAIDALILSDERGVLKPDPAIFELACAELAVAPANALMVGDNAVNDGAATAIGCRFQLVTPAEHGTDGLLRAVGLS
jgi:putative hydrolase of the HAD superfamily